MSQPQLPFSSEPTRAISAFTGVATFALLAALLYLGAGILVPLVLAILLAFALAPLVTWFGKRLHVPDPVAVVFAVMLALTALGGFAFLAGTQVIKLAEELPGYRQTISSKVSGLQEQFGSNSILDRINSTIAGVGDQLDGAEAPRPGAPLPVTISNEIGPVGILSSVLGSIIGPVATVAIVAVFLVFLLMGRADLQERFIRLVSAGRYSKANLAIADASYRVGRYLLIQLAVNTVYGIIFGLGLWLIGVPSAILWGLLIILFRYIPFVGAMIIATIPLLLAFAVDPGWNMFLMSLGLFLVLDLTTANVIEPRLYGSSTGVSAIAILLSAMFWATLWGPVGLILATPMTVCLVVIGRHLPQFRFLETLLGSEPVLSPPERLYQRMLRGNTEDAIETTEDYIETHDTRAYLDNVMMPALRMASNELAHGAEALPQRRMLVASFEAVVDEISNVDWPEHSPILLVGGRTEIDECVATILGLHLAEEGLSSRVLPPVAVRQEAIGRLDLEGVKLIVLVFAGADIRTHARYVSRRIGRMAPGLRVVVVALHELSLGETVEGLHVEAIYRSVEEAVDGVAARWRNSEGGTASGHAPSQPFAGAGRGDDALGRAIQAVADSFDIPVAAINLLQDERHMEEEEAFRLTSLVAETGQPLVIHSETPHPLVGENGYLLTNGIDLYAAVPLVLADGSCVGALALMDYEPRSFGPEDIARLEASASELVETFSKATTHSS
ncbi:AI-2E family transporter [Devosia alba]|uniref:AI-2E family transporter n=1 Tax=Devosia alba TaxID=3152360 RepID=UPI003264EC24